MMNRRTALGVIAAAVTPGSLKAAAAMEPEYFKEKLEAKELPPLAERLPKTPRVVNVAAMGREPGRYGGVIRSLIGSQKDIRLMTINGYARLIGYDERLTLQADILESFEVTDGRV